MREARRLTSGARRLSYDRSSDNVATPQLPTRLIRAWRTSTVARASWRARWLGATPAPRCTASSASRWPRVSCRCNTRLASARVQTVGGSGHWWPVAVAAARRNPRSNLALWATSTAPRENSRNVDITAARAGAPTRSPGLMPVSRLICPGSGPSIETNVDNSARTAPPRTRTAPISVISSVPGLVPVVSRSTTTKVISDSNGSRSSNAAWTPGGGVGPDRVMAWTVAPGSDR